jgi:hypothetical protein
VEYPDTFCRGFVIGASFTFILFSFFSFFSGSIKSVEVYHHMTINVYAERQTDRNLLVYDNISFMHSIASYIINIALLHPRIDPFTHNHDASHTNLTN